MALPPRAARLGPDPGGGCSPGASLFRPESGTGLHRAAPLPPPPIVRVARALDHYPAPRRAGFFCAAARAPPARARARANTRAAHPLPPRPCAPQPASGRAIVRSGPRAKPAPPRPDNGPALARQRGHRARLALTVQQLPHNSHARKSAARFIFLICSSNALVTLLDRLACSVVLESLF
jgi:hypothetical protein